MANKVDRLAAQTMEVAASGIRSGQVADKEIDVTLERRAKATRAFLASMEGKP